MALVGLLTLQQKEELVDQSYAIDSYFYPIQDNNGDWIISTEEIDNCINPNFLWVKSLPLITYVPIPRPPVLI